MFYEWRWKGLKRNVLWMHQTFFFPISGYGGNVFKLLMWNEMIKDNMSELSILKGAETFISTIQFFEAWRRRLSPLCGTLFRPHELIMTFTWVCLSNKKKCCLGCSTMISNESFAQKRETNNVIVTLKVCTSASILADLKQKLGYLMFWFHYFSKLDSNDGLIALWCSQNWFIWGFFFVLFF